MAAPFGSSETHLYFLLGNELHWINDASTLVKLGSLVDFRDEKHKLNFVQIQVSRAIFKFMTFDTMHFWLISFALVSI